MSWTASALRGGAGMTVKSYAAKTRPEKPLELYEFEACPFCRKVREVLTALDLDALVYPCPKGGTRYRPLAAEKSGKQQFPFLVDPNTGEQVLESDAIIHYLAERYGDGRAPLSARLGPVVVLSGSLASGMRAGHGGRARPSKAPAKPLELWSFEASPYCRLAREALCELELPYLLHNVGKGSSQRKSFIARSGKMMVPYLADPNTGREMFESAEIVRYLEETYGGAAS
jgi:glutathione S-transferase